jgi:hypothetical protein
MGFGGASDPTSRSVLDRKSAFSYIVSWTRGEWKDWEISK